MKILSKCGTFRTFHADINNAVYLKRSNPNLLHARLHVIQSLSCRQTFILQWSKYLLLPCMTSLLVPMSFKFGTCYWMVQISCLPLANSENTCLETPNLSLVCLLAKTTNKPLNYIINYQMQVSVLMQYILVFPVFYSSKLLV